MKKTLCLTLKYVVGNGEEKALSEMNRNAE